MGIGYSLVVPPFETPDEIYHYAFARHLALGNGLPDQNAAEVGRWEQEGSQAPLYYLILGRLIAEIDHSDFDVLATVNPRANLGDPHYPGNKNYMLYSGELPDVRGTRLAVLVGRWFSLILACLSLWMLYQTARLAFPDRTRPLLVLLLAASIPQFAFISASVSNDPMIIATASATVYWLCRLAARPLDSSIRRYEWILLGVLLALAALSKLQGLGLVGLAGLTILLLGRLRQDRRMVIQAAVIGSLVGLVLGGWWYGRNLILYGDPLARQTLLEIEGLRGTAPSLGEFWGELRGLRYSFWGLFGWFNLLLPGWTYVLLDGLTIVALIGIVTGGLRGARGVTGRGFGSLTWLEQPRRRVLLCLGVWLAIMVAAMFYWLSIAMGGQGRLILPAIGSIAVFMVLGWQRALLLLMHVLRPILIGVRWRIRSPLVAVSVFSSVGLVACSLYALTHLLPTAYQRAQPIVDLPPDAIAVNRVYGDVLELVAIHKPRQAVALGEPVPVTLYFQKLRKTGHDYELFVQLLNPDIKEIANVTTHPGWGSNPTSMWQVGEVYADTYTLVVEDLRMVDTDAASLMPARLFVGFRNGDEELLEVSGYEWDIDSMTVGRVWIEQAP